MNLNKPQKINLERTLKYLGDKNPKQSILDELKECEQKVLSASCPKTTYIDLDEIPKNLLVGEDIKKHLEGCFGMIVFCVTLGVETDKQIRLMGVSSVAKQVMCDALASVLTEEVSEAFEKELCEKYKKNDVFLTSSYAPGYGDYPLSVMPEYAKLLNISKQIGVSITSDNFMTPRKSILVVMGKANHPVSGFRAGCEHCLRKDKCKLKAEGKSCVR